MGQLAVGGELEGRHQAPVPSEGLETPSLGLSVVDCFNSAIELLQTGARLRGWCRGLEDLDEALPSSGLSFSICTVGWGQDSMLDKGSSSQTGCS